MKLQVQNNIIDLLQVRWREMPFSETMVLFLTAEERTKSKRFRIEDDYKRYVIGRALLRRMAGRYLGAKPEDIRIETTAHGKPFFPAYKDKLSFNVSHSGEWIFIVFSAGLDIGVDVQLVDRGPRFRGEKVAKYAFHPDEKRALHAGDDADRHDLFYSIWTCKEAVIKAAGLGLHGALEKFSVLPLPRDKEWALVDCHNTLNDAVFLVQTIICDDNHKSALAVCSNDKYFKINYLNVAQSFWS